MFSGNMFSLNNAGKYSLCDITSEMVPGGNRIWYIAAGFN